MANKAIKGISIQIGADTLGLDKALKDVEAKSRTASSELKAINSAIKTAGDSAVLWQQKQQILNDALEKSREKVRILEDAQKGFAERFRSGEIDKGAYDKFREKLDKAKDKLKNLKSQQEQWEAKFKNGEIDQGQYDKFCKSVETAENRVKALETAEHSMEENLRLGNISADQYRAFQREVEYARAAVEKYESGLKDANEKVEQLGSESSDTADDVKELGDKADSAASGGISAMTVALGNLVADGIKKAGSELKDFTADVIQTGASFEAAMSNVGAISGASAGDLEKLTAKAEEMGAATKFTAAESAEAFQYMAMAGWKTEDMLSGIDGILSLAAASGEDLGTTSDIVTDALTAFGLTADDAGHFADVLAAASSNANTNVSMMGETFKYVAPIAGALNFSIEDIAEAIGLMANSGIKASQAGTSLRAILTAMTDTGDKAYFAFQELGVETLNADGSMRGLNEILSELRISWQKLTEAEQADYAQRIAGKEAMSGFLSLVNAAPEDIDKLSGAIRECDGAAAGMSATMVDNLQGDMTILDSAIDGMKISLSKKLNPALRDVTQYITSQIPNVERVLEKIGSKAIGLIDKGVKNLPQIIDGGKKLIPVVKGVGTAFAAWKIAQKASDGAVSAKKLFDTVKTGDSIMKKFNATLRVNPAGVVITGVAALTAAVIKLKKAHKDENEELTKVNDAYKEEKEKLDAAKQSMDDMKSSFDDKAVSIHDETQRTKDLWGELEKLADKSGIVKEKDKERADYILGELNSALGTEYELTGNQIQGYQDLAREIDNVIAKKEAEQLMDSFSAESGEMRKKYLEAQEEYYNYVNQSKDAQALAMVMQSEIYNATGYNLKNMSISEAREKFERNGNQILLENSDLTYDEVISMFDEYEAAVKDSENKASLADEAKQNYDMASEYLDKLKSGYELISSGNYDKVASTLYADVNRNMSTLRNYAEHDKQELTRAYKEEMTRLISDLSLAFESGSQRGVDEVSTAMEETVGLAKKAGINSSGEFVDEFSQIVNEMLDKGFDISQLAEWGKDSGIDIGDVFQGDFKALVQGQIDKGFDIRNLVVWGANSGITIGDNYDKEFERIVQEALNKFYPDDSYMIQWAMDKGLSLGQLFGENFSYYAERAFWDNWNENGIQNINSASDEAAYYAGTYGIGDKSDLKYWNPETGEQYYAKDHPDWVEKFAGIKAYAKGGFLGSGQGIIAEAGPELIEIMNGGARITPLSGTARNTAVSGTTGTGSQKNFYSSYTINATIAGRYDVTRLAEDLETERRRIEMEKGL
nr:MAG TPA: minor tail protein [Caudoviricetes sp.]